MPGDCTGKAPRTEGGKTYTFSPMQRVTLLGVPLDPLTVDQAVACLKQLLADDTQHHVMTPNSEMLVEACRDPDFRAILRTTTVNLPDSVGLTWMARWTSQHLPERTAGVDVLTRLLHDPDQSCRVFLLGAAPGVAQRAAAALSEHNPRLTICGTYAGSPHKADAPDIVARINAAAPDLLLVAYGAPAQDRWIHEHLHELSPVHVALGVGGTFDFWAGERVRAPQWMRSLGLEWLWRVIREPRRIGRILTAVIVFPLCVLRYGKTAPR